MSGSGDDPTEREVSGGDSLGKGDDVGLEIEATRGEPVTTPSEPGDHLIGDEERAGSPHQVAHLWEIALRRWSDPAGADHRLAEDSRDPFRADVVDRLLHRLGIIVRHQHHVFDQRAVAEPVRLHPPQRGAVSVHPVIGPLPGEEHGPLRLTDLVEVATGQLGGGIDRVGAATGEKDLALDGSGATGDAVGELQRRRRDEIDEGVVGVERCICRATASATSGRPYPMLANHSEAVPSR